MRKRTNDTAARHDVVDLRTSVDSLQRGLEILRTFRAGDNSLSVGELATRTGLPRPTVARLVNTLAAQRFLCAIPGTDRYRADVACQSVGRALLASHALVQAGSAGVRALAERFSVDASIAVPERLDMMCVAQSRRAADAAHDALGPVEALTMTGALRPIVATSAGRAWLWSQPAPLQGEMVQSIRADATARGGAVAMPQIYRAFQELEERGYCMQSGEGSPRLAALAAPIAVAGQRGGALTCYIATSRADFAALTETLGNEMIALAQQIGRSAAVL